MRIAVVTFPGSNCDEDAVHVLRNVLSVDAVRVWHRDAALPAGTDGVILPGGFSYGDALRSGALARFSPIMGAVKAHADKGGLVLGICNGMQILVESGMLPGAMLQNASRKFVCRWVDVEVQTVNTAYTRFYRPGQKLRIPVAHHEGCYFAPPELVAELNAEDRIVFRYREGDNPNGATDRIAGLVNKERNVMGMMPHPERASETLLGSDDGKALFVAMVESAAGRAA